MKCHAHCGRQREGMVAVGIDRFGREEVAEFVTRSRPLAPAAAQDMPALVAIDLSRG